MFLSKLPDVSDKFFSPEGAVADSEEGEARKEGEIVPKKKVMKRKSKGKAK